MLMDLKSPSSRATRCGHLEFEQAGKVKLSLTCRAWARRDGVRAVTMDMKDHSA